MSRTDEIWRIFISFMCMWCEIDEWMDTFTACELLDLFSKLLFEMAHNDLILMLMTDLIAFCRILFEFLIRYIWYLFNVRNSISIRCQFVSFFNIRVPSPISMFYSRFNLSFSDECKSLNFKPPSVLTDSIRC